MHYHLLPRRPLGCQAHRAGLRAGCVNHFLRKKGIDFWEGVASQTLLIERWAVTRPVGSAGSGKADCALNWRAAAMVSARPQGPLTEELQPCVQIVRRPGFATKFA